MKDRDARPSYLEHPYYNCILAYDISFSDQWEQPERVR